MSEDDISKEQQDSLFSALRKLTGQVAGGTLEIARTTATMTAMFGETWLRNALVNTLEPERLEAMAEAGRFLRDAREMAGISLKDLADSLGMADKAMLEDVESGESILPLETMLRATALLARHDPIPFLLKFMRTYNPQLEKTLEQWGVMALPKHFERERRFVNIYRQHDFLRALTDEEHDRFIDYMQSSTNLVIEVMEKEKTANRPAAKAKPKAAARKAPRKAAPKKRKAAPRTKKS
ncbi:MAG: helix-turn-helix transcriptional regulator [Halieaceae bacterium]